ncbi:hypothetical protein MBLNU459_g4616t3 [Dothideomycetes sp. NU459]
MAHHRRAFNSASAAKPCRASDVKRWDSRSRTYSEWDGLRHDEELWSENGDCLVHLYSKGRSRRNPSFKTSFTRLKEVESGPLFSMCFAQTTSERSSLPRAFGAHGSSSSLSDSGYSSASSPDNTFELYVPAPDYASREDAFQWHLATRNYFAWVSDMPLVGATLGKSLIDLLQRMTLFRSERADNMQDLLSYAHRLGYLDFRHCPDYALAFLCFAEHYRMRDLWTDAFAHCVGMNDKLCLSPEFDAISKVTKALITRAYLEMDLHLGRVTRALRTFLEEELSPTNFGLSLSAQAHLDRFRSFLHSYYVNKFGYWPPERGAIFSKTLLRSMYSEFHNLYEFIVDMDSSDVLSAKLASGGICVLQNVNAFNQRHNYEPLPHPLPLLPECDSSHGKIQSQRALRSFRLGSKNTKFEKGMTIRTALAMATNTVSSEVLECPLVRDYISFEREWSANAEEKISVIDARKVRWIVIYSILQMLISVTRAPKEVRNAEGTAYPLCLLTTGTPPWSNAQDYQNSLKQRVASLVSEPAGHNDSLIEDVKPVENGRCSPALSIHPDCEAEDYFSHGAAHGRLGSISSLRPEPLRISSAPVARSSSIRSLQRSVMSMSFVSRRSSVKGSPSSHRLSTSYSAALAPTEHWTEARTPTLDVFMLGHPAEPTSPTDTEASSPLSMPSPHSTSSTSSDRDDTDAFSWSSNDERRSSRSLYSMDHESVFDDATSAKLGTSSTASSPTPSGHGSFAFGLPAPTSKFSHRRAASGSSSVYPEQPIQASDIAEVQRLSQQIHASDLYEAQQMNLPMWWPGDPPSRPGSSSSNKQDSWPLAVSVPQEVPEDGEMVFAGQEDFGRARMAEGEVQPGNALSIDIYGALDLLPASVVVHAR